MGERAKFFKDLIDSSEMICSLKYEDMRGCPYGAFTRHDIAEFSLTCAALVIISLAGGM